MHGPQTRLAPIADGVEPPGFEPLHRLLAPALAPIRAEFALEVSGVKVEGATMIERAAGLRPQSATVVVLAPMRGKLSIRRRQIAEHKLTTVDIGFPSERNHVHPDREEAIALGGDEPPSPVTLLGTEEARRTKAAHLRKPTEAVAPRALGQPLRDCVRFLGSFGAEYLGRTHLLRPRTRKELAEAVDDAFIGGAIRLDARRFDEQSWGVDGRGIPRRTSVTSEASMAPSVAVTGNVPGSRPAGASEGPAIMPIDRGGGAPIEIARLPAVRGAIATSPVNDRLIWSSTCNSKVSASSPGFSTGMTSRLVRDQSQVPASGLKISAGRSSAANTTRSLCPSRDPIVAWDVSTIISSPPVVAISRERAIAIEQWKPFSMVTRSLGYTPQ